MAAGFVGDLYTGLGSSLMAYGAGFVAFSGIGTFYTSGSGCSSITTFSGNLRAGTSGVGRFLFLGTGTGIWG